MGMKFVLVCALVALFVSVSLANEEEFTSFFEYLSTFHSYYPERAPPIPSVTLPTIFVADTDDSSAPFGLLTFSREGAIPTFALPPASYFRTSLFGHGIDDDGYIIESSVAGVDNNSSSSTLQVTAALILCMVAIFI